ncbi:MAG: hypothetical protein K8T25_04595 [Planctomycetia bacterium]|nr:hypothetical protein [Planctomycetia bacterium]
MKTAARVLALSIVVLAAAASGREAEAGWPWGCGYGGYGGGYNWGFQQYALTNNQMPPYFAMYPPVYYRLPFGGRTYGSSPFAYPAEQVQYVAPRPVVVENQYVPAAKAKSTASSNGTSRRIAPMIVLNPYVQPEKDTPIASTER